MLLKRTESNVTVQKVSFTRLAKPGNVQFTTRKCAIFGQA
jgi:hypothetical protein